VRRFVASLSDGKGFDILLVSAAMLFLLALAGIPLLYNILMSFQEVDMFTLGSFIRPWAGLDNYRYIFSQPEFWLVMKNTALFVFCSIAGQFVLGFGLAIFFQQRFPAAGTISYSLLTGCRT
jgi:multiple sugar transport system permease protein